MKSAGVAGAQQAPVRFGKNALSKFVYLQYIDHCAYCGDKFSPYRPPKPDGTVATIPDLEKAFGFEWQKITTPEFKALNEKVDDFIEEYQRLKQQARRDAERQRLEEAQALKRKLAQSTQGMTRRELREFKQEQRELRKRERAIHAAREAEKQQNGPPQQHYQFQNQLNIPTYDHIRPENAFKLPGDVNHGLENGILACGECNSKRGNIPIVEFLNGEITSYVYTFTKGKEYPDVSPQYPEPRFVNAKRTERRRQGLSSYLKSFIENGVKLHNATVRNSWFVAALDNLLYPVWGKEAPPATTLDYTRAYKNRVKALIKQLSTADSAFWLGSEFEKVVRQDFNKNSLPQKALLEAIRSGRQDYGITVKRPLAQPAFASSNPFTHRASDNFQAFPAKAVAHA